MKDIGLKTVEPPPAVNGYSDQDQRQDEQNQIDFQHGLLALQAALFLTSFAVGGTQLFSVAVVERA